MPGIRRRLRRAAVAALALGALSALYWYWSNVSAVFVTAPPSVNVSISWGVCVGRESKNEDTLWTCYALRGQRSLTLRNGEAIKRYNVDVGPDQYIGFDAELNRW